MVGEAQRMMPPPPDESSVGSHRAGGGTGREEEEEELPKVPTKLPMGTPSPIGEVAVPGTATKGKETIGRKANSSVVPSPNLSILDDTGTSNVGTACHSHLARASAGRCQATSTARSSAPVTTHYVKCAKPSDKISYNNLRLTVEVKHASSSIAATVSSNILGDVPSTNHSTAEPSHTSSFQRPPTDISHNSLTSGTSLKKRSTHPLRRGKWTFEEEIYATRLIHEFKSGLLPLTDGTTLRHFLSKLLNCGPMRISKKFVGHNCIGKQIFKSRVSNNRLTPEQIQQTQVELSNLERRFFEQLDQMNHCRTSGVEPGGHSVLSSARVHSSDSLDAPPTPPWLKAPKTYKPKGRFAEMATEGGTPVSLPASTEQLEESIPTVMTTIERSSSSALDKLARTASMSAEQQSAEDPNRSTKEIIM